MALDLRMRFPFLTGTELMLGNVSSCNASRDNVSGLDELNFAWDPWEALWGVSWPNALNALDGTVAFQFSVTGPERTRWAGRGRGDWRGRLKHVTSSCRLKLWHTLWCAKVVNPALTPDT